VGPDLGFSLFACGTILFSKMLTIIDISNGCRHFYRGHFVSQHTIMLGQDAFEIHMLDFFKSSGKWSISFLGANAQCSIILSKNDFFYFTV